MSPAIIYFEETKLQLGKEIARGQIEKFRGGDRYKVLLQMVEGD